MTKRPVDALSIALDALNKQYGLNTVLWMDADPAPVDVIPTGALSLDLALGIGGLPRGRVVEIYGREGSGKSTIAQSVVAEAQRLGGTALYLDMEHSLDPIYAQAIGVKVDDLLLSQPDSGEDALTVLEKVVASGGISVAVVDSVAALVPRAELEGEMGDANIGAHARLMSQAMRKLTGVIDRSNTLVIFINQIRINIGQWGNPETTTGGKALKFYSSVRLEVSKAESIKTADVTSGTKTRCKVVKNKLAPPFRTAEFDIVYGKGISRAGNILDIAVQHGIVEKHGAWFQYNGVNVGHGREATKLYLEQNPDVLSEIYDLVIKDL